MADKNERIRSRAYEIWEREGRPHGREAEHWHQAASEIEAESQKKSGDGEKRTRRAAAGGAPPSGISSGLQPSGTAPGGGPGASQGGAGTGGGSAGSTGNVKKSRKSGAAS